MVRWTVAKCVVSLVTGSTRVTSTLLCRQCCLLSPVLADNGASHGAELVGIALLFGVNQASGLVGLGSGLLCRGSTPFEGLEGQGAQCPAEGRCQSV